MPLFEADASIRPSRRRYNEKSPPPDALPTPAQLLRWQRIRLGLSNLGLLTGCALTTFGFFVHLFQVLDPYPLPVAGAGMMLLARIMRPKHESEVPACLGALPTALGGDGLDGPEEICFVVSILFGWWSRVMATIVGMVLLAYETLMVEDMLEYETRVTRLELYAALYVPAVVALPFVWTAEKTRVGL